jgi:dTDP-4-amino-4,6-dideoxy-D-galactose acyltransferase
MELKMLDWDSSFFEKKIFSVELNNDDDIDEIEFQLQKENADLAYIFLPFNSKIVDLVNQKSNFVLYDHKLTYKILLSGKSFQSSQNVEETIDLPHSDFISLAISSGEYSRFALDPSLNHKFELMYELWLRNSLNKKLADKVFVTKYNEFITAFITCKIKDGVGNVGLIATHKNFRGKSLGRTLINHVHQWYTQNDIQVSEVVTQKANHVACSFYENYGFEISKEELVYHWQIKNIWISWIRVICLVQICLEIFYH